jgi:hypothetical protein
VALVECLFDEADTGTAGCSKDKKLHNFAFYRTDETDEWACW